MSSTSCQSKTPAADPRRAALLQDIRSVDWSHQVPAFHFNTKLAQLLSCGCSASPKWVETCEKLVSSLPSTSAICGATGRTVDPFRGARQAFVSNRTGDSSEIPLHISRMWELAKTRPETARTGLYHGNLIEILEMSGIVGSGTSRHFYVNVLGMHSTPQEDASSLLIEAEGEALCSSATRTHLAGATFCQLTAGRRVLWEESGGKLFLSMEGYGCICRWRVLASEKVAIVIQPLDAEFTSVTNLAEHVRDACLERFGKDVECYEFYEPSPREPISDPCLITGGQGTPAGFVPVSLSSLPALSPWLSHRGG